jgi:pimeloyl-ACP methyl ester carboxylesterase
VKKVVKAFGIVLLTSCLLLLLLLTALLLMSPGRAVPIAGPDHRPLPGSVSEIRKFRIGGVDQVVIIRGHDRANPVLLFLHGGPGSPEYPFFRMVASDLERKFTVVHWEQRGAGKSFSTKIPPGSMTVGQFVSDTIELAGRLEEMFGQKRIFLLGHSWGAALGMLVVQKRPDLFRAYVGVGQAVSLIDSEKLAYAWVMDQARSRKNAKAAAQLGKIGAPPYPANEFYKKRIEMTWVMKFGGGPIHDTRGMVRTMLSAIATTPEYTLADKVNYFRGNARSLALMWDQLAEVDLRTQVRSVGIPVFILQGKYDYQVSTPMAEAFLDGLAAPAKRFVLFENSAHGTIFEEPEKFLAIMTNDVIRVR